MSGKSEAQVDHVEDVKRRTAKRKSAVVLDLIKGKSLLPQPVVLNTVPGYTVGLAPAISGPFSALTRRSAGVFTPRFLAFCPTGHLPS